MRRITIVIAALAGLAGIQAIAQTVDGLDLEAIRRRAAAMQGDADVFAEHVRNRGDAFREEAVAIQAKSGANLASLAKADLPVNGDGAFDFDEIIKGASQNVAGTKGDAPQFISFASLSMPPAALRQLIADTAKAGGVVVFRGFPNNSMKAFSAMLGKVVTDKDQLSNVGIDPRLFRAFNVEAVPTYVAVSTDFDLCSGLNCTTSVPTHDKITGNVSVRYVLDTFVAAHGPGAGVASVALRNLGKGL
ncbi:conjugal transfer pilus assembly protein TrbC [Sphingomonas sp. PP-F2F-A104-K0414]|uniref:type-F conjugative transfer system pilin assembly protein TrbC n=1 Tax=Sphingomonas sp. PP-F2F-A104-K0414 TaxID=2135661 RepID=UPI00104BD92C|nr:type-F conjugative transfer system pilin assembly protein TrbC [Sphingomonas sp. PP-F2F-A104-K0414]TCP97553.1 conjugal transfer pilus assembly protein TrbC [Sphingomonas sp. PP-F2F-A104-K0414]